MSEQQPERFGTSAELVPVRALITGQRHGEGAILCMKDGSYRMLVQAGSTNFDMKNPLEQSGLTYAFGALVNSLEVEFPLQIVSHSKMLDIDAYVRQFQARLQSPRTPPQIQRLIEDHIEHFEQQVKVNKLLAREIYVVVPWKGVKGPMQRSPTDEIPFAGIFKAFGKNIEERALKRVPSDLDIVTARQQLEIRSDQVIGRLNQMGIWAHRLEEDDVRKLLYNLYHPALSERQRDPGFDSGGGLLGGFSAEGLPQARRRLSDGGRMDLGWAAE